MIWVFPNLLEVLTPPGIESERLEARRMVEAAKSMVNTRAIHAAEMALRAATNEALRRVG